MFEVLDCLNITVAILVCLVCGFVAAAGYFHYIHKKYDHIPGPPRDSFWSGHTKSIAKVLSTGKVVDDYLLDMSYKYGHTFRINLWHRTFVLTTNAEGVKHVTVTGNHPKSKMMYEQLGQVLGARFIGRCLDTEVDSKLWVKRRQILDTWFKPIHQRANVHSCNESADQLISALDQLADGRTPVILLEYFKKVAIDLLMKVGYGVDLNVFADKPHPFVEAITTPYTGFAKKLENPFFFINPLEWKFCLNVWRSCNFLRSFGSNLFIERNKAVARGEYIPEDLVTIILRLKELIPGLPAEITEDEFVNFIVAGHETTGLLLTYISIALGQHPDVYKKLQAEVDEVIGSKAVVTLEDINKCVYLDMVVKETLRLFPPIPHTFRQTMRPCEINGHRIPKGTELWVSYYVTSRHSDNVRDPENFDPERFRPGKEEKYKCETGENGTFLYITCRAANETIIKKSVTYKHGTRKCHETISDFWNEAKTVLIKQVQSFDFSLVPDQPVGLIEMVSLRPKGGGTCFLRRRHIN